MPDPGYLVRLSAGLRSAMTLDWVKNVIDKSIPSDKLSAIDREASVVSRVIAPSEVLEDGAIDAT